MQYNQPNNINLRRFLWQYASIIFRLEARLQPNIGFTLRRVLAMFARSAITPQKVNRLKFGALWAHCRRLAMADFGRDPRSSDSWRARRIFCQVSNAPFHRRFAVGQISRNLNTTRRSVSWWKLSDQSIKNFTVMVVFPETQKFLKNC